jgi:putative tricarboxylic transport membrane protein
MQEVMQAEGISSGSGENVPGAGGTVGLAQFVGLASGDASQLIVGGYVMVGAILTNASPVSLADVTPIARLTGEAVAIVVSAASPIQDIKGLVER